MPESPHPLPEVIAEKLEAFRRKLWRAKAAEAALAAAFGLLGAFLMVFLLDRVIDTPVWLRVALLVCGTSLLAVFAPHWIHRWLWRHRRPDQLAKLVRRTHPRFGDRLLGAVELAGQDEKQTALSPVLRAAALRQIAEETARRGTLNDALPRSRHRRWAAIVTGLVAAVAAGFALAPDAGWNSFLRWVNPLGHTPRYTFTRILPLPPRLVVAQGEPFTLAPRLGEDSKQMPDLASVTVGGDMPFSVRRDGRDYPFRFNGLLTPQILRFQIGDARPEVAVVPLPRPGLAKLQGLLSYPDYLGLPADTLNLEDGLLNMVEGATIRLEGEASRPLASFTLEAIEGPADPLPAIAIDGRLFRADHTLAAAPLPPVAADAGPDPLPEAKRRLALHFTDQEGLAPKAPFVMMFKTVADTPPNVYLEGAERESTILEDEILEFRAIAGDDFGIKRIGFDWTTVPDGQPLPPDARPNGESPLGEGSALARRLEAPAVFSPAALKLGPQTLRLRAWAEDYKPGRPRAYSEALTVTIMDRSQHAEMLRRRFGQLMDGLEELSRREETDHEENKRLDRLEPGEMRAPGNKERLDGQRDAEKHNRESMEQLRDGAKQLFRDALRNKDMDAETMKDWSEMLKNLGDLSAEDMPRVEDLLRQAADQDNNDAARQDKKMAESVEEQKKVLQKMREAMRKANRVEQNMEAGTFVNRLRSAARTTGSLAGALRENLLRGVATGGDSETAGIGADKLTKDAFAHLQETAKRQDLTRLELADLQEDFGHFFRRTGKAVYEELRKEMEDARTTDSYEKMAGDIRRNWAGRTTPELLAWATRLNGWADKLAPKKPGGGGGGGGGGQSPEDSDVELMLRLLRFVQQTQDVQGQTRRIERGKADLAVPNAHAPAPAPAPPRSRAPTDPNPL